MALTNSLGIKVNNGTELASYIVNQIPELSAEIDLPVQGDTTYIPRLGKLISSDSRFKNAFLNIVNKIALTVIKDNTWENPWDAFTEKGTFQWGESVEELFVDIANVYDYHTYENDVDHFLENVVPNVYNYIHILNYEKFYKTSTSDEQMAMGFKDERSFFRMIESIVQSLYEGYKYDKYIVEKYMLCRRLLDGTVTAVTLGEDSDIRDLVANMKSISNQMIFRSPNYNPAGVRSFSPFNRQYLIMNTLLEARVSTNVMATSYFRNDADFKTNMSLIDSFYKHDTLRLAEVLGSSFVPFTEAEIENLYYAVACIVDYDFFQVYNKAFDNESELTSRSFENPETLKTNHWLHVKKVMSTSPFAPACVFVFGAPKVNSVTVSPTTATVTKGQELKLSASVNAINFANKAVTWATNKPGILIKLDGTLIVPADTQVTQVTVTATSVFDNTKKGTATITIV